MGLNDPWYNYRVGTQVHALEGAQRLSGVADAVSQQRSYRQQRAVYPCSSTRSGAKEGNGYLPSKSRFLFMAAFRERFNEKVVAEMRGVIDEQGLLAVLGEPGQTLFRHGVFPCRLPVRHRTEGFHCRPDAQASAVYRFPFP
ncbi:arginine N-succinyltransferase [Klebsiella pneumoniae subsp. pneumoniae]|nr:arginine N-succinyltransferase [Klebsiella pneumoniae subsp. pneumoniae]